MKKKHTKKKHYQDIGEDVGKISLNDLRLSLEGLRKQYDKIQEGGEVNQEEAFRSPALAAMDADTDHLVFGLPPLPNLAPYPSTGCYIPASPLLQVPSSTSSNCASPALTALQPIISTSPSDGSFFPVPNQMHPFSSCTPPLYPQLSSGYSNHTYENQMRPKMHNYQYSNQSKHQVPIANHMSQKENRHKMPSRNHSRSKDQNSAAAKRSNVCRHYLRGFCKFGAGCKFKHTLQCKMPNDQVVFLGGLPENITSYTLKKELEKNYDVKVCNDPTILSNYAPKVAFESPDEAKKLIDIKQITILGDTVDVRPFKDKFKTEKEESMVFLGGFPDDIKVNDLLKQMEELGYKVVNRPRMGQGYARNVQLESPAKANDLIRKKSIILFDSTIDVRPYVNIFAEGRVLNSKEDTYESESNTSIPITVQMAMAYDNLTDLYSQ